MMKIATALLVCLMMTLSTDCLSANLSTQRSIERVTTVNDTKQ